MTFRGIGPTATALLAAVLAASSGAHGARVVSSADASAMTPGVKRRSERLPLAPLRIAAGGGRGWRSKSPNGGHRRKQAIRAARLRKYGTKKHGRYR